MYVRGVRRIFFRSGGGLGETYGEREPMTGVWRRSPQQCPGQGVSEAKPPETESMLAFQCPMEAANLPHFQCFANSVSHR